MKSVKFKNIFLSFLLCGLPCFLPHAFAEDNGTDKITSQFSSIETRLANLEKGQQDILAKEDKILEELDRIRIWVHRK